MGVGQFALGAMSGLLVGLLTDGTPRGMVLLMFLRSAGAAIDDLFRPRGERSSTLVSILS